VYEKLPASVTVRSSTKKIGQVRNGRYKTA
jgi:hypothetical protein